MEAETRRLLREYRERGDVDARRLLVEGHLPLVRAIARRFAFRGEQMEDLVQVGSIGLVKAIDRFDPERGADLTAFATATIVGEVRRHLRDLGWPVRVPRPIQALSAVLPSVVADLAAELERPPTTGELAERAKLPVSRVEEALRAAAVRTPVSLSTLAGTRGDPGATLADPARGAYELSEDRALLAAGFRALDERERRILLLRFFAGLPQAEIAAAVGISQIHVSRLIRRGLAKLHDELAEAV